MARTSALQALQFSQQYRTGKAVDKERQRKDETLAAKENTQWAGNALDREDYVPYLQKVYDKGIKAGRPMEVIGKALDMGKEGDLSGGKEVLRQFYRDGMRGGVVPETERTRKLAGFDPSIAERAAEAEITYKEGQTADIAIDNLREQNKALQQQIRDIQEETNRQARLGLETRRVEALEAGEEREVSEATREATDLANKQEVAMYGSERGLEQVGRIRTWIDEQGGRGWFGGADAMGAWAALKFIPGTDAYELDSMVLPLKAKAFMENIQNLRGMGHLSNIEGSKAEAAIANLDPGAGYDIFMPQLQEIQSFLELGHERARKNIIITKKGEQKQDGVVVDPITGNESVEVTW